MKINMVLSFSMCDISKLNIKYMLHSNALQQKKMYLTNTVHLNIMEY